MHLRRSWVGLGLLAALAAGLAAHAAVVYKWTDADGVVHLSDQPVPGAERIVTASGSGHAGTVVPGIPTAPGAPPPKTKGPGLEFAQFAITSPSSEETITGNQPVNVHLGLEPALSPTQTISWSLNGQPLTNEPPDAVQFTLDDLPRGTYSLSATVSDQSSGETKSTEAVTFYVVKTTLLSPQRKATQ